MSAGRLETVLEQHIAEDMHRYAVYPGHREGTRRLRAFIEYISERLDAQDR
ncbi:hypothetical protein [Cupriavidus sp. CP313]